MPILTLWLAFAGAKIWALIYNEEKIGEILNSWKDKINESDAPEHRKTFWTERITGLQNAMPKKKTIGDTYDYSKKEIQIFLANFKSLLLWLWREFWRWFFLTLKSISDRLLWNNSEENSSTGEVWWKVSEILWKKEE